MGLSHRHCIPTCMSLATNNPNTHSTVLLNRLYHLSSETIIATWPNTNHADYSLRKKTSVSCTMEFLDSDIPFLHNYVFEKLLCNEPEVHPFKSYSCAKKGCMLLRNVM